MPDSDARERPSDIERLQEQVEKLTEQVAALSTSSMRAPDTDGGQRRCFYCNHVGHVQCVTTAAKTRKVAVASYATGKVT